ncbi:MAG: metallophosphatase, partial [Paludibacter sp.]|nr:metallophosphatase [Paludibacter sp.]
MKYINCLILILFAQMTFAQQTKHIVVLHTNDTHSQVEPTDAGAKEPNMGGYARRMGVIDSVRAVEPNVLLLDAGDYFQGSPYFNFFNGRVEIAAMNRMRYDAATLGNHEFDNGLDTLAAVLKLANFPVVCANYELSNTPIASEVKPYIVIERFGLRIGIFGLTVNPKGLVFDKNYEGIVYNDPIEAANKTAKILKKKKKCDLIICLSHLGSVKEGLEVSDYDLANNSEYIDVILGGHTHTLLDDNTTAQNKLGKAVLISQMGKSGLYLGRIDLNLTK